MTKRFGRNQRRKMREEIERLEGDLKATQANYHNECWRVVRLQRRVQYLENVPLSARCEKQSDHSCRGDYYAAQVKLDIIKLGQIRMTEQDLLKVVSQELMGAMMDCSELRALIKKPPEKIDTLPGMLSPAGTPLWMGYDPAKGSED